VTAKKVTARFLQRYPFSANELMPLVRSILALALLTIAGVVNATPISFSFSGVVTSYFDYDASGQLVKTGQKFNGGYTIDYANAETTFPGYFDSQSGCNGMTNGTCELDYGQDLRLVTSWFVDFGAMVRTWTAPSSTVYVGASAGSTQQEKYMNVVEGQGVQIGTFDNGLFTQYGRAIQLLARSPGDASADPAAFQDGVSSDDLDDSTFVISETTFQCVTKLNACSSGQVSTGFQIVGSLDSWARVTGSESEIPEPATISLFGIAFVALAVKRRSKPQVMLRSSDS
jgi:hypothetical protein